MNKLNHSSAVLAQITVRLNSEKNAEVPPLMSFLPYPQAGFQPLNIPWPILQAMVNGRHRLDPLLAAMLDKREFYAQLCATYYWQSNVWLYE